MSLVNVGFDVLHEILLNADLQSTIYLCQTNKEIYNICLSEDFWEKKVKLYYNITTKLSNISWSNFFVSIWESIYKIYT